MEIFKLYNSLVHILMENILDILVKFWYIYQGIFLLQRRNSIVKITFYCIINIIYPNYSCNYKFNWHSYISAWFALRVIDYCNNLIKWIERQCTSKTCQIYTTKIYTMHCKKIIITWWWEIVEYYILTYRFVTITANKHIAQVVFNHILLYSKVAFLLSISILQIHWMHYIKRNYVLEINVADDEPFNLIRDLQCMSKIRFS